MYEGVDAQRKRSHVAVMDRDETLLKSVDIPSSRPGVADTLGRYKRPIKAVLEASYAWEPMHHWLDEFADEVVLAHPLKVRAIADTRIKTDKFDACVLAHLLRADLIPTAYVPSRDTRRVKRVLRQRCFLIRVRTMVKNRIAALLSWNSVQRPNVSRL
ncbi:MAG: transposase [Phycisphaerae bacterium]|nr:transposase [Phycisphaerae bacterium]